MGWFRIFYYNSDRIVSYYEQKNQIKNQIRQQIKHNIATAFFFVSIEDCFFIEHTINDYANQHLHNVIYKEIRHKLDI